MSELFRELHRRHVNLLQKSRSTPAHETLVSEAMTVLEEIRASGRWISDADERQRLESYSTYWGTFVFQLSDTYPNTALDPADTVAIVTLEWEQALSTALHRACGTLTEAGFGEEIRSTIEQTAKWKPLEKLGTFESALNRAIMAIEHHDTDLWLRKPTFIEAVVSGLLDPIRGLNLEAVAEQQLQPGEARAMREFFGILEAELTSSLFWGPLLQSYQHVRYSEKVVRSLRVPAPRAIEPGTARIPHDEMAPPRVVVGDIAVAAGAGNVKVDTMYDAEVLRNAYLHGILEQTQTLQLTGVDPKVAQDATARSGLDLAAVYTAVMTQQSEQELGRRGQVDPTWEARRLSAVELLDREPKLALLGDPGSGKSTFVNFVALCMAGEALGRPDANLALLTTPMPQEERNQEDEKPQPQAWKHGTLLPMRVVLRDFAASGLPSVGQRATGDHLWRFIAARLGDTLTDFAPILYRTLLEEGGLVLLDGLDEVPEAEDRRVQVKQAVAGFAGDFPRCRFLVTSRTYAYQRQDWKLPGFAEGVLAPFRWGQIERFVDNWYAHWAQVRNQNPVDAQGRATLLKGTIQRSERLRELAERPLLLTLMASLHAWRGGSLPEKREELYADAVDLLLDQWESPKVVRDAQGKPVVQQPSLAEWLRVDHDAVRKLLEELAFEAQRDQPELVGTADIAQQRLVDGLLELTSNPDVKPKRVIEFVCDRAGLLTARGTGVYSFPHRTFQEYLAACRLTGAGFPDEVAELALADGDRWREVALLAGAKAARGTAAAVWTLADALCCEDPPQLPDAAHSLGALLAAQTLIENGVLAQASERNQRKAERVRQWLLAIVDQGLLSPVDRAKAGDALCLMGDDRPGVGVCNGVPDIAWCPVPAGDFIMGEGKQQRIINLSEFAISKYPITNAQFNAFVQDGGFTAKQWRSCWTKDGLGWKRDRTGPDRYGGAFDLPSHPVVGVSWHEAVAFCNWLGQKLGQQISLPTEEQWERAARHTDGRRYPWGDKITPDHANTGETGIGTTTAVGIFPKGKCECGALDTSGNVWEWCLNEYSNPERVQLEGNANRVLRGGAWDENQDAAAAAFRNGSRPGHHFVDCGVRVCAVIRQE